LAGIPDIGRLVGAAIRSPCGAARRGPGDRAAQNRARSAASAPAVRGARVGRIAVVRRGPALPRAVILADVQLEDGEAIESEPAQRADPDEWG
jgi:hypothetical protein